MKTAFQVTMAILAVSVLATSVSVFAAEESCRSWSSASADPTKGRYALELRTCDLTYGLSAYVEIKNSSTTRVALAYRIFTNDDKSRDSEIILEPGKTTRAENCQACAKRHVGFKSWEILTASEAPAEEAGISTTTAAPLPAFMEKTINANKPVAPPATEVAKPVDKPVEKTIVEPVVSKPVAPVPAPVVPVVTEQPKTQKAVPAATEPEKKVEDGFRAEDGTIIPWEQLPPEFRPRK